MYLKGIQMKGYDYVAVNEENDRVIFKNMDLYYKRGIPYYGEVGTWDGIFRSNLPEVQHDDLCIVPFTDVPYHCDNFSL